jgi:hypothetical protein
MNKKNISLLKSGGYKYIIGARIKNENQEVKQWILSLKKNNGAFNETIKDGSSLIVGYYDSRTKKDKYNREKGVSHLIKSFKSGKITKENINKRGYNKFLEISDNVKVNINQQKIINDEKWDGLKGYITNTSLSAKEVYEQYNSLLVIEKAFRVTKETIKLRPLFHFTPRRIEEHVCICFVTYKMYKELERILKLKNIILIVNKVLNIAKTITTIKINLPERGYKLTKTMLITPKHKSIAKLFDENFWKSL